MLRRKEEIGQRRRKVVSSELFVCLIQLEWKHDQGFFFFSVFFYLLVRCHLKVFSTRIVSTEHELTSRREEGDDWKHLLKCRKVGEICMGAAEGGNAQFIC